MYFAFSWITEQIAVGAGFSDEDIPYIKNKDLDAIVDLRSEYSDNEQRLKEFGMQFLHIKVDDRYSPTFEQLDEIFNFVQPLLDNGKKILIHCQNGCGRSPLVAIAILAKKSMNIADAVNLVENKHPQTGFTEQQQRFIYSQLDEFLKSNKG